MMLTIMRTATLALSCFLLSVSFSYSQSYWENNPAYPQTYTSGRVGIGGMANVNTKLQIFANGSQSNYGISIYNSSATTSLGSKFGMYIALNDSAPTIPNYGIYSLVPTGSKYWAGYFRGNGYFSGNVGIGTGDEFNPPSERLSVWNGNLVIGSQYNKFVFHNQYWTSAGTFLAIAPWDATMSQWDFTKSLTLHNSGLVEMKAASIKDTLKVHEKIWTKSLEVKLPPFPDYVFTPVYELMPIDSIAFYIKEHGHLPGLPSAKNIDSAEGYDVGNLLVKQMEKIEELTLYIIELNAEIERLKRAQKQTKQ